MDPLNATNWGSLYATDALSWTPQMLYPGPQCLAKCEHVGLNRTVTSELVQQTHLKRVTRSFQRPVICGSQKELNLKSTSSLLQRSNPLSKLCFVNFVHRIFFSNSGRHGCSLHLQVKGTSLNGICGSTENETVASLKNLGLSPACDSFTRAQSGWKKGRKPCNLFEVVKHTKTGQQMRETRKRSHILISLSRILVSRVKQKNMKEGLIRASESHLFS